VQKICERIFSNVLAHCHDTKFMTDTHAPGLLRRAAFIGEQGGGNFPRAANFMMIDKAANY
jgi:hypothetical protein